MTHGQRAVTCVLLTGGGSFHWDTRPPKTKPLISPAAPTRNTGEMKRAAIDALGSYKAVFIRLKGPVTRSSLQAPAGGGVGAHLSACKAFI